MDPVKLFTRTVVGNYAPKVVSGSWVPAAVLVLAWAASVVVAARLRHTLVLWLDAILGAALALGLLSSARIFGLVFDYLLLWAWGLAALMLFAVGCSVGALVRIWCPQRWLPRVTQVAMTALAAVAIILTVSLSASATRVDVQSPPANAAIRSLSAQTASALSRMRGKGQHGPFLITWQPAQSDIGSVGYGLANELVRRGWNVRSDVRLGKYVPDSASPHVIRPDKAHVEVHLATELSNIKQWRADSRFHEVAYYDPRLDLDRLGMSHVGKQLLRELQSAGFDKMGRLDYETVALLYLTKEVPSHAHELLNELLLLGPPRAVFVGPAGFVDPTGAS
jgi:hypothetical protein